MSPEVKLSNQEIYANLKTFEQVQRSPADFKTVGVKKGRKIKVLKKKDNLFSKLWFLLQRFFGVIKTDPKRVEALKNRVLKLASDPSYINWANKEGKVTKQGRIHLISKYEEMKNTEVELRNEVTNLQQRYDLLKKSHHTLERDHEKLNAKNTALKNAANKTGKETHPEASDRKKHHKSGHKKPQEVDIPVEA